MKPNTKVRQCEAGLIRKCRHDATIKCSCCDMWLCDFHKTHDRPLDHFLCPDIPYEHMSLSEKIKYTQKLMRIIADRQLEEFKIPLISGKIETECHDCHPGSGKIKPGISALYCDIIKAGDYCKDRHEISLMFYITVYDNNNFESDPEGIHFEICESHGEGSFVFKNLPIRWTGNIERDYLLYGEKLREQINLIDLLSILLSNNNPNPVLEIVAYLIWSKGWGYRLNTEIKNEL